MLEPGHYANMFEVKLPEELEVILVACERSKFSSLKELRHEILEAGKEAFIYAPEQSGIIYGYGPDIEWLRDKGFNDIKVNLAEEPRLTGKMIIDSFISKAKTQGYTPFFPNEIGRCKLFNWNEFRPSSDGNVKVYLGFDIRTIFLFDETTEDLSFSIIVDVCYSLKDSDDKPLNFHDIVSKFGSATLRQVRQIQRDLLPTGKLNTEVSRQRLVEQIFPFISSIDAIALPCGINAAVSQNPLRIIVGAENGTLW
jgi:hypothetical protein